MKVREKWVEMMNAAMERHGHEQRLNASSWADQGRPDLAELVEPKLRAGQDHQTLALHAHVDGLREQRAELPAAHLSADKVIDQWEQQAEQKIAEVREREAQELSRLDKLIAAAREFAHEVKDRTVAFAKDVKERAGSLFGREPKEEQAKAHEKTQEQAPAPEQARPPTPEMQARLDELIAGFQQRMEAQLSVQQRAAEFGSRMDAKLQAQELARQQQAEAQKAQEQAKAKEPEVEAKHEQSRRLGFGLSR